MSRRVLAAAAALLLPLAGCGGDGGDGDGSGGDAQRPSASAGQGEGPGGSGGSNGGGSGGSGDSGGSGGSGGGGAPALTAVCPLLPAARVSQAFGVAGVSASEDEKSTVGTGTLYGCTYQQGTDFSLQLGVTVEETDADPAKTLDTTTTGVSGVERLDGLGDAAAYWASEGGIGEFVMVVKRSGPQLRTITLSSVGSGRKDTLVALGREVAGKI